MKTRYTVKRYNIVRNVWSYYNSFNNYKDAAKARDELQKRYGGHFEVFQVEEED